MMGERYADKFKTDVYDATSNINLKDDSSPTFNVVNSKLRVDNIKIKTSLMVYDIVGKMTNHFQLNANEVSEICIPKGINILSFRNSNSIKLFKIFVQ